MEIHEMEKGSTDSLMTHGRSECECKPIKSVSAYRKTMGKFATVVFTHK